MAARRLVAEFRIVPLLALLFISASAAAPTAEEAARAAREAFDRGQYDLTLGIVKPALQRYGSRNDETIWALHVLHGQALQAKGDQPAVQKALEAEPPAAFRTSELAVRRLLVLGLAALVLDQPKEMSRRLSAARTIAETHQPRMMGEVYRSLALTARDLATAEKYAQQAIAVANQYGDRRTEAQAMATMQYIRGRGGHYADAILWGEKTLALAKEQQMPKVASSAAGNMGWQYVELGDYETAEELLTHANLISAEIRAEADRVVWLVQLGNARVMQGDRAAGDRYYRQAVEHARPIRHHHLGYALANLASLAVDGGRLEDARRFNTQALDVKRQAKDAEGQLRSQIIDARIDAGAGKIDAATQTLRRVIDQSESPVTQWEARGRLAEVFAKAKRDQLADQEFRRAIQTVSAARQAVDKELRLSFFNTTTDIFAAYLDFLFERQRLARALEATELIRTEALDETLEVKARRAFVDPRVIAKQQNAIILSYWLGPKRSYFWKITPAEIRAAAIAPEKTIRTAVDGYRRDLLGAHGTLEGSRARGGRLFEMLGAPKKSARDSRVIVIPDGNLHALNFETLVVPGPKPHFWIEDVNVMAASSIQLLARRAAPPPGSPRMLLIGNPLQADPAFPRLPHAGEEIAKVESHFPPARRKVLSGAAATPAAYLSASPQTFDFVHFVAHGVATRRRPLESAVILGEDATKNYRLLAREILKQPLHARLVTISSCHGAGTRAYTGEGLVGLAWAFLRAGASNVIAALWEANDSATPLLMDDFYRGIARGRDPATALREAKLRLLKRNDAYRKPFYWAPFVLYAGR